MTGWWVKTVHVAALLLAAAPAYSQSFRSVSDETSGLISTLDADLLRDLPVSDNVFAVLESIQPSLISDRFSNGGLYAGQAARIAGFGASWSQTVFRVGDIDVTDPDGAGSPLLFPDLAHWRSLSIATGLMPAGLNASGLVVTLEPTRPSTAWVRVVSATASGGGLTGGAPAGSAPAITRLDGWSRVALSATGPIVADRIGAVFAGSWTRGSQFDRSQVEPFEANAGSAFAHVVITPQGGADEIGVTGWVHRARGPFAHRVAFGQLDASTIESSVHTQAAWDRRGAGPLHIRLFGGVTHRDRTDDRRPVAAMPVFERLLDGPVTQLADASPGSARRWSVGAQASPAASIGTGAGHAFHIGVEVGGSRSVKTGFFAGDVGEVVDGAPARLWRFARPGIDAVRHQLTVAAYASDRMVPTPRLTVDLAIRFDAESGLADGAAQGIGWRSWLPRAAVTWAAGTSWKISTLAGYARSAYRLPLDLLAVGDPAAPTANVYRWSGGTGTGSLVARAGPGTGSGRTPLSRIDSSLKRPLTDEIVVGMESWPWESFRLSLMGIIRRESNLLGLVNVGVPDSGYALLGVEDPGLDFVLPDDDQILPIYDRLPETFGLDRYLLTNGGQDDAVLKGFEISIRWATKRFLLEGGGTAAMAEGSGGNRGFGPLENEQSIPGELLGNPNATTHARGRLFNDRAFTGKLVSVYQFPKDIRLGAIARYQDGQPFTRMVIAPGLSQGAEAVRAFPAGGSRFTYIGTLDVRLQKGFAFGGRRLDAILDVYNLPGMSNEVEERIVTGQGFRDVTAVQPPRAVHLGVRATF